MMVTEARSSDLDTSLDQIVSDVREVEAEDILDQLVNMIDDQRYPYSVIISKVTSSYFCCLGVRGH